MKLSQLKVRSLGPLDTMALIRRYFANVKAMDRKAVSGEKMSVDAIMKLWDSAGELKLTGPEPIGERLYKGADELAKFYDARARGMDAALSTNVSRVNLANAKSADRITVSGIRYVVNAKGEGTEAPFTHNFVLGPKGHIQSLHIHIGPAAKTSVAPAGTLRIQDMGRLAAMAWMVA